MHPQSVSVQLSCDRSTIVTIHPRLLLEPTSEGELADTPVALYFRASIYVNQKIMTRGF